MIKIILIPCMCFFLLLGCASKDIKKFGSQIALSNGSSNPIAVTAGIIVGGLVYGTGYLLDTGEKKVVKKEAKKDDDLKSSKNESSLLK